MLRPEGPSVVASRGRLIFVVIERRLSLADRLKLLTTIRAVRVGDPQGVGSPASMGE
jgi:hypothetical protein